MAIGDMTSYRVQVRANGNRNNQAQLSVPDRSAFVCYNGQEIANKLGKAFKENLADESIFE